MSFLKTRLSAADLAGECLIVGAAEAEDAVEGGSVIRLAAQRGAWWEGSHVTTTAGRRYPTCQKRRASDLTRSKTPSRRFVISFRQRRCHLRAPCSVRASELILSFFSITQLHRGTPDDVAPDKQSWSDERGQQIRRDTRYADVEPIH